MGFKHKERNIDAMIPTASMADIAFLLIIFFILTMKFHLDRTQVELPKSQVRNEVPQGSAYVIVYEVDGGYGYKFSDGDKSSRPVTDLTALDSEVNFKVATNSTTPFVIKAPASIPYRYIDEIIEILRRAGVEDIVLLTDQRTVDDA